LLPFGCPSPILPRIQKRLQNQHRRHLVNDPLAPHGGVSRLIQMPVSLGSRQPLVPQMDRHGKLRPQVLGKGLCLGSLWALVAGHIKRIAHHGFRHSMLAQDTGQPLEISAPVRPMQCKQRLRRIAQRVGDGQPDPPVAHIEPQNPRRNFPVHRRLSGKRATGNLGMDRIFLHCFESIRESTRRTVK
jgi:hypothetical protein